ncbi:hypothetical protein HUA74_06670 [Myxococcus sp. CA051A]|uniref:hypothetical protein n=1 Tax=unclassified Myxococcus TaxID=2648731 RepID=UPI00157A285C|nr:MULTISPECIES: hypothetical protein [unclassified Myxococcus]NTX11063.1 hypothetical protein [Myxococcus sp. CA056]NTX60338.1 hypothetical protein [Myxococcus sp. CA051A]
MSSVSGSSGGSRGADSASRSDSSTRSESTESARADAAKADAAKAEAAKAEAAKAEAAKAAAAAQAVQASLQVDAFTAAPPAAPVDINPQLSMLSPTPISQQVVAGQPPGFTAASVLSANPLGQPTSFTGTLSTQGLMAAANRLETPAMREAWSGAQLAAQRAKDIATEMGFSVSSTKRTKTGSIGSKSTSDHHTSQTNAYAYDFPAEGTKGTKLAEAIAKAYGFPVDQLGTYHKQPFTFQDKEYRVQVLWGSNIDHDDHVHVGVRNLD